MPKQILRKQILEKRKQLSMAECLSRSELAQRQFLSLAEFSTARSVALYCPVWNEVRTEEIFRSARRLGKEVAYPRLAAGGIEFVLTSSLDELVVAAFGIPEPTGSRIVPLGGLDLIAVPGVVFDVSGYRLGYGKGFYDRLFHRADCPGVLTGLCFEFQLVEALPVEDHDLRLDQLVTEQRVLNFC